MWCVLLVLSLLAMPAVQRVVPPPAVAISVWYGAPMSVELGVVRENVAMIRRAGFDAITTPVVWRDAHPRRGAFQLLEMDRAIAAAAEAGLKVRLKVFMDARPAWGVTDEDAGAFFDYVRRRAMLHPAVLTVDAATVKDDRPFERIVVGTEPGEVTPRLARLRLWEGVARGQKSIGFVGAGNLLTPALGAVGETAGVITRNQALFGPLQPRDPSLQRPFVTGGDGAVEVFILESADAMVIVGLNRADAVKKVTVTFSPEIPEAIWQNIEEGVAVNFVMGNVGPVLAHTFGPQDVLVLTIRKKLR